MPIANVFDPYTGGANGGGVPSPGGGAKLNGDTLVKEAAEEKKDLLQRLLDEFEEPARFSTY